MPPVQAAIEGTREIGPAVTATTISLIAVFLPLAFMSGIVGQFMKSFGWTMAFAIAVSLIVSFTLTPSLSARWLGGGRKALRPAVDSLGHEEARRLPPSRRSMTEGGSTTRWITGTAGSSSTLCGAGGWSSS